MKKMNAVKRILTAALAGAMVFGLAACGSSNGQDAQVNGADAAASSGKTMIKVGLANTVSTLQPFKGTGLYYGFIDGQVYQRLGQRTDFNTQSFTPVLMTEYKTEDGVSYDITIRDDIHDSNGVAVTAEDVAWCFNYVKENGLSGNAYIDHAEATGDYSLTLTLADDALGCLRGGVHRHEGILRGVRGRHGDTACGNRPLHCDGVYHRKQSGFGGERKLLGR